MQKASPIRPSRADLGFTLVELMITVSIVGILAALAVPAFSHYLNRSRAQEATDFINIIRLRQESYRSEFGQYCDAKTTHPAAVPGTRPVSWSPPPADWQQLGANPDGWVRFSYTSPAGLPGADNLPGDNRWGLTGNDFWYVVTAVGDLDGIGAQVTFGTASGKRDIWCSSDRGWE